MAKRRSSKSSSRSSNKVSVERARGGQGWVLVHPRDVLECAEDLEEVREMIAASEADVAVDELRWLVETCPEMIEAHYLLGKLAVESMGDVPLGRGHFGFGYQLGERALAKAKNPAPVTALHPANRPFFDAGRGTGVVPGGTWQARHVAGSDRVPAQVRSERPSGAGRVG